MRKFSKSRGIIYQFGFNNTIDFKESDAEKILEPAKTDGIVHEYDTGRGSCLWFTGTPGKELRAIRDSIESLLGVKSGRWVDHD